MELRKISQFPSSAFAADQKYLVELSDGTYAYVLGSEISGGGISGTGTLNYIPKIATVDGVNILTLEDSRIYDDGSTILYADAGTAGKLEASNVSKVIGLYSQTSDSYIYIDGNNLSIYYGTRIHSSVQNAVTGKHFSFISVTGINDNTVAVFSPDTHGTKLVSSAVTTTQLTTLSTGAGGGVRYLSTDNAGVLTWQSVSGGGTTTNPLTIGTGLSGTSFNGSAPVTIAIDSSVVTLTGSQALSNKTGLISQWTNDAGYLTSLSGAVTSVSGTANRITSTGGATPVIDISASYVGQSSITTIGTLSSGAVPASLVTAGTFGSGAYTMGTSLTTPSLIGVSGAQAYSTTAQSSGAITDFRFTPSNHTGQTASTNSPVFKIAASTKTLAAGTVSAFYGTSIESTTVSFASASTITNGYNLFVDSFPTGTNATVTNPYSIGTNGFIRIAAGSTTQGTIIRNDTTTNYGAIYNGNVTPSNSNFAIKYNGTTTFVNGATGGSLFLTYNAGSVVNISGPTAFGFADGVNVSTGTTTGTKFGTATSQKIAFFNKTPIIQPTTGITGATLVGGGGTTITSTDTFGGYTLQQLAAVIINLGLAA